MPGADIGNLFRYESADDFEQKLNSIKNHADFFEVNRSNAKGRPQAALNKYLDFLRSSGNASTSNEQNEVNRNMNVSAN